jgi:molybdopterin-containing oxidoreductase family iron-sulfur binding subunit
MPEFPVPQQKGTVGKCILCVHNINVGKMPYCVEACTMEALYIADLATDVATNGRETVKLSKLLRDNDAVRFREELGTRPRVWYILGHGQDLAY